MLSSLAALLLVTTASASAVITSTQPHGKCSANQVFTTCGTACEPSCSNPSPQICTLQCIIGCQCASGYLRDNNKNCVLPSQCNSTSTETPVDTKPTCALIDCRIGFTCDESSGEPKCVRQTDIPLPVLTCATILCRNGYVCVNKPNGGGNCVPAGTESIENENQITCANVRCAGGECQMVDRNCHLGRCERYPKCITENACASTSCPVGTECRLQEVTCIMAPCNPIAICFVDLESSPTTRGGRSSTDVPSVCGANEESVECYNACSDARCDGVEMMCPAVCRAPGCKCRTGFYRHPSTGQCVTKSECPVTSTEGHPFQ